MKYILIITTFALLITTSCKKSGFATLEGTVFETGTNDPIPNAYVRIKRSVLGTNGKAVAHTTTDKDGHFKINFTKSAISNNYYLDVISGEHESLFDQAIENRKTATITTLTPYSYLKVRVKNNLPTHCSIYFETNCHNKYSRYLSVGGNKDTTFNAFYYIYTYKPTDITWYTDFNSKFYATVTSNNKWDTITYLVEIK